MMVTVLTESKYYAIGFTAGMLCGWAYEVPGRDVDVGRRASLACHRWTPCRDTFIGNSLSSQSCKTCD
jgi:hypothetical protein